MAKEVDNHIASSPFANGVVTHYGWSTFTTARKHVYSWMRYRETDTQINVYEPIRFDNVNTRAMLRGTSFPVRAET